MRPLQIEVEVNKHAEGSALIKLEIRITFAPQVLKIMFPDGCEERFK